MKDRNEKILCVLDLDEAKQTAFTLLMNGFEVKIKSTTLTPIHSYGPGKPEFNQIALYYKIATFETPENSDEKLASGTAPASSDEASGFGTAPASSDEASGTAPASSDDK